MRSSRIINWLVVAGCTLLFACDQTALYNQYQVIEDTTWAKDKVYYFTFELDDVSESYDIVLDIRNNNKYRYQNLWLFCNQEPPIGALKKDTIECMLADDFGKWKGHGISLFESSFPIRRQYHFQHPGQYTFSFRQGMRDSTLIGIQEIGLRVIPNAPSAKSPNEEK